MEIAKKLIAEERSDMSAGRGLDEQNKVIPHIRTDLLAGMAFLLMAGLVAAGMADS